MNAVLITGNTYPHRRELARLGGRWAKDHGGYLFPSGAAESAAAEFAATWGLGIRDLVVDEAELAPPSYADRRAAQADRHARRADRLEARADRRALDRSRAEEAIARNPLMSGSFDPAQPILVGHHSERKHRRDADRLERSMRRSVELDRDETRLRDAAAGAERAATQDADRPLGFMMRRVEELEAEYRQVGRSIERYGEGAGEWVTARRADLGYLQDAIAYWRELIEAKGGIPYSRETIRPGMVVLTRFGRAEVIRSNTKTVTVAHLVPALIGHTGKYPYAELKGIEASDG